MEDATNFLTALPEDSLFAVVSFLDFKDSHFASRLSLLNSSIRNALSLSTLHNGIDWKWQDCLRISIGTPWRRILANLLFVLSIHGILLVVSCWWRRWTSTSSHELENEHHYPWYSRQLDRTKLSSFAASHCKCVGSRHKCVSFFYKCSVWLLLWHNKKKLLKQTLHYLMNS